MHWSHVQVGKRKGVQSRYYLRGRENGVPTPCDGGDQGVVFGQIPFPQARNGDRRGWGTGGFP
jgi:hypothetical protein